ncbi:YjjG family noncanonical pyrimidine nucleotidase, partial [Candidatus Bipolaricaulota bacterium]|nr:YjjG family noncanonical pyrimidine nucleotidase [Candidatus Bipolaricaulota bacterium]
MTSYTWLILDADGTLLDFRRAEAVALGRTPVQMKLQVPGDFCDIYHAINDSLWREFEAGVLRTHEVRTERFMRVFEKLGIAADSNAFSDAFLENIIRESTFIDGAEHLLARLENRIGLVLLTNGFADVQRARIARLGLGDTFGCVIISGEVGVAKPDRAIFEIAFERMGQPDKANVLIIGDSLSSDIQGGADYGIDTCWFNPD